MEPKTSWGILKNESTKGIPQDIVGYQIQVYRAARTFMAVREFLSDKEAAEAEFHADPEVKPAFEYYAKFEKMGWI